MSNLVTSRIFMNESLYRDRIYPDYGFGGGYEYGHAGYHGTTKVSQERYIGGCANLSDGKQYKAADHYEAWLKFMTQYIKERAERGIMLEYGSPTYSKHSYNFLELGYSYSGNEDFKSLMKKFITLYWADWTQVSIDGVRGGAKTRNHKTVGGLGNGGELISFYMGGAGNPGVYGFWNMFCDYELPDILWKMSLDREGLGKFEYISKGIGEEENIYVFVNPDNTMDTYTVTASDNIKLTKDENGDYTATYLETGDAWVRATSNNNPEVYDQVDFVIEEKKTAEEVKANIVGTWTGGLPNMDGSSMIENAATVEFTSEDAAEAGYKKGYFTLNSSDTGFTFIPGQKYEFTYKIDETYSRDDRVLVLISSITYVSEGGMEYTYDNNYAFFEFNGEDANIVFSLSDPNYYGYTIDLDCKKVD